MNSIFRIPMLACLSFLFIMTSCTNENQNFDAFADDTLFLVESETRSGRLGCYELVYPVTVEFPDGSTQEVDDVETLRSTIRTWKEENQDVSGRPHLAFPYEIVTEDGSVITVEDRTQMIELRRECRAEMGQGPHANLGKPCFRLVFPISIEFPNGNVVEFENRKEMKYAIRAWKKMNPNATERPHIEFPLTVKFEDGSTQTVESKEDLIALKKDCRG